MRIINVNVVRHADGKQVYIKIMAENGTEYTLCGDQISIVFDPSLPNPLDKNSPVTVWQGDRLVI